MKDYLKQILDGVENRMLARCIIREYLQARLLQSLQDHGTFNTWVFQGGTALRFLYFIPRFSEDLDFALMEPAIEDNFRQVLTKVKRLFESEDYQVRVKINDAKTVKTAFVRFQELLFELDLSSHKSEVLSIRVKIDTNPPAGAGISSTIVRRHVTLNLRHHNKASLLAGKLHAVLSRPYVKGRDIYDLIWYLSDRSWPGPNIVLLNNALKQTKWHGPDFTDENWQDIVRNKLTNFNWEQIIEDVRPFLERPADLALLTRENVLGLLQQ